MTVVCKVRFIGVLGCVGLFYYVYQAIAPTLCLLKVRLVLLD